MSDLDKILKVYEESVIKPEIDKINEGKGTTVAAIQKKANQLKKKLDGKPVKENFGQKEVRQLEDYADIWSLSYQDRMKAIKIIDDFNNWAMNYTG